jgi:hypothetical protein
MTVDTRYAPALVVCVFDSWIDVPDYAQWLEQMVADGQLKAHTSALVDFRRVNALPAHDCLSRALAHMKPYPISPGRIAFVIGTFTQYRFIEEITSLCSSTGQIRAFQEESHALDWLFPTIKFPGRFLD